jgi:hypothetical protein
VAKRSAAPVGAAANAALAGKAAAAGTRAAGKAVSSAVSRAKVPVIAGGAAAAGLVGGLAVIRRHQGGTRRNGAFDFDNIIAAAQRLGSFGEEIGRAATAIQRATESPKRSK